ncbi:MAG: Late embryosis abundant protein [Tardiphaga sp.]|jgi:nucleotide-binding universal stress UspA family protein|nr:Late embryosis abundant protein [Tardiphaga sp.]
MADQTLKATDQIGSAASPGFEKAATAAKTVTDQALAAGRDLKDRAADLAGASTETIKDQASEFVDAAKDMASQATDKFKETVDGQRTAGANYVGSLADTIRRAAREFDADLPIAGTYIRKAASQVEGAADTIRTGNFNDLVRGAQSFARRQPTAFLGMAVLAGFGVVRFLKSSANDSDSANPPSASSNNSASKPVRWHDDSKGYRDEFTK